AQTDPRPKPVIRIPMRALSSHRLKRSLSLLAGSEPAATTAGAAPSQSPSPSPSPTIEVVSPRCGDARPKVTKRSASEAGMGDGDRDGDGESGYNAGVAAAVSASKGNENSKSSYSNEHGAIVAVAVQRGWGKKPRVQDDLDCDLREDTRHSTHSAHGGGSGRGSAMMGEDSQRTLVAESGSGEYGTCAALSSVSVERKSLVGDTVMGEVGQIKREVEGEMGICSVGLYGSGGGGKGQVIGNEATGETWKVRKVGKGTRVKRAAQ
ncbi:hypothetical protein HDU93_008028, partial [Gonapodya sp. JEL0774]